MNRICLLFDRSYVEAHFCFREMAAQFLKNGWWVDLFMPFSVRHQVPVYDSDNIRIRFFDHSKKGLVKLLSQLSCFDREKYKAIVATPQWALYWAVRIGKVRRIPVVCLSDEVYTWDPKAWSIAQKGSFNQKKWKKREAWAHRHCVLTVALGEDRFKLAKRENSIPDSHPYVMVPNAPSGQGNRLQSSFYRDTLGISDQDTILLHSGGCGWSHINDLVKSSSTWGRGLNLVFQGRYKGVSSNIDSNENIRVSRVLLPSDLMQYATSSADIGLMLYDQNDPEEARNGNTAGKLGLYLSCGLPIICCNLEVLKWLETEGCGVWVPNVFEIPQAVQKILSNYKEYSRNALRVFEQKFEYSKHFEIFLRKLEELI